MTKKRAPTTTTKRPHGRPTKYKPEYDELAFKYCLLGATNEKLAELFEVAVSSIDLWIADHASFSGAVKAGREEADAKVADSLYRRALGYEHQAVKIVADARTGAEHIVPYTERYPPDTTAAIFWLKNRQRAQWRDRTDTTLTGANDGPVQQEVTNRISLDFDEVKKRIESLK